mmetsp:Transcript_12667/g.39989  ORF Transcript_12667/g.39989 Transcript_12667/m.39989 type:complete len:290 (+) Transcript_12667:213-1082(+)
MSTPAVRLGSLTIFSFDIPPYVMGETTGSVWKDLLPLITMMSTFPTIYMFWNLNRKYDAFFFSLGAVFATIYHALAMSEGGLKSSFLGLDGMAWRTIDILACINLIQRSWVDIIGASHLTIHMVPNVVFPMLAVHALTRPGVNEDDIGRLFYSCNAVCLGMKLLIEGTSFPKYNVGAFLRAVGCVCMAAIWFFLCEVHHDMYWLYHSMWHVFMSHGYFLTYSEAKHDVAEQWSRFKARIGRRGKKGGARGQRKGSTKGMKEPAAKFSFPGLATMRCLGNRALGASEVTE